MAELAPMDILRKMSPEEKEITDIMSCAVDDQKDSEGYIKLIFEKNTPKKIIRKYRKDYILMPFKTKGDYTIEK